MGRVTINGHIPRNPFAQFHISPNSKEREYLTENELKTLMEFQFKDPKNSYLRDIFVFASFAALSFVDIKELSNDQIVEVNGEKWIISKRHKTGVPFQVKLLDIPLRITIPSDTGNIWMNEMELVELFGLIAPTLRAVMKLLNP